MTRQALALAGAAATLAVAALTACSGAAPPPATAGNPFTAGPSASGQPATGQSAGGSSAVGSSAGGPSAAGLPAATPSAARSACKQQYDVWQQGPGQGLVATLTAFGQAATVTDLTDALTKAKPALARASQNPMPQCADPRGYWMVLVMHVNAAAASTSSKSSVKTALKGVPAIAHALLTELHQTAAVT